MSYATNMWWRLANYTVKTSDMKGNCYVCVTVGDSCCTYVPDNDADGHLIDQEIRNITKAVDKMTSRERNRDDWNWNLSFSSLFNKIEHGFILIVIIKIIFKCDYERLPCCSGKTRR